jgi:hypothetical protein
MLRRRIRVVNKIEGIDEVGVTRWLCREKHGQEDIVRSILGPIAITAFSGFSMVTGAHAQIVFTDVTEEAGIALTEWLTESVAWGDFDNDGDLDLVVTADMGEPNRLWRNDSPSGRHWLGVRLQGTRSNASAIGARVVVTTAEGSIVQEVSGGAGRGSQNSLPLEFGLGTATTVKELTIRWPSGTVQTHRNIAVDRYIHLTEPSLTLRRSRARRATAGAASAVGTHGVSSKE